MTYMLNSIDEAIDRKFLVTKTMPSQVEAGTIVHIMGAEEAKDGSVTVYYRITYTNQDFQIKFNSIKDFCKWARPDNFIARHYEDFSIKEIQRYIKVKDKTFVTSGLPILLVLLVIVWAVAILVLKGTTGIVLGAILSVVAAIGSFIFFKSSKNKQMTRYYSKFSSNWRVNIK